MELQLDPRLKTTHPGRGCERFRSAPVSVTLTSHFKEQACRAKATARSPGPFAQSRFQVLHITTNVSMAKYEDPWHDVIHASPCGQTHGGEVVFAGGDGDGLF